MIDASVGPLLVVFAAVARLGSFSAAASSLKVSKSIVSERIKLLEDRCGVRLLERTTRRVRLTAAGAEVLDTAARIEDSLGLLSRKLDAGHEEPTGTLRVSTTNDLGPLLVGPTVARFVTAYPKVQVDILSEDVSHDLIAAQIDVAVRLGVPKSSSFVSRKLAVLKEPIVAAPALAGRLGAVSSPRELENAPWIRHSLVSKGSMRFIGPAGQVEEIEPVFRAQANSGATVLSLLLHGAGLGVLPEHSLREHVHNGRLIVMCPGWIWKTVTLHALVPSRASIRPAHKAFIAMLQDQLVRDKSRWSTDAIAG